MALSGIASKLFAKPNKVEREIQKFIDDMIDKGMDLSAIDGAISEKYPEPSVALYADAYVVWRLNPGRDNVVDEPLDEEKIKDEFGDLIQGFQDEDRTQEDILEFGDLDDDDEEEDNGSPIARLIKMGEEAGKKMGLAKEEDNDEPIIGFGLEVDETRHEHLVEEDWPDEIYPKDDTYVHVDLILPEGYEAEGTLHFLMGTNKSEYPVEAWFDEAAITIFRDGNHLHVKPASNKRVFGEDITYKYGDYLYCQLYEDNDLLWERRIYIIDKESEDKPEPTDQPEPKQENDYPLKKIHHQVGWDIFKEKMDYLVLQKRASGKREDMNLEPLLPNLHTVIVGNPGTGKSTAARMMADFCCKIGLLSSATPRVTRLSELATSTVNGEYDATMEAVKSADSAGAALIFDNAHELYKIDGKDNYNTELRIIRALSDALDNKEKYHDWALILVGEPEGMESLLSANPDFARHFNQPIYMEDFAPEELFQLADRIADEKGIDLSDEAASKLEMYILHKYNHRGPGFQNARMVQRLFDEDIVPAMFQRIALIENPSAEQLKTVEAEDIPMVRSAADSSEMAALDELVGLEKIKSKVKDYLNAVKLAGRRMELGLPTNMPRLHMAFLGNPGTGKTTVAEIIGKVFASWGILSGGRVIRTEKSQMVGQYIGETEFKMRNLLARARGNILFIDEAYQLVEGGEKDYGRIVMNSLLTELGKDNLDMVVILAGYTAPMKKLLESNEGIESRFPNVFNFEDYTTDELLEIGKLMIRKQGFILTDGAAANMRAIIEEEAEKPSQRFGNGRFVSNLLQNEILATLGARTAAIDNPTREQLSTILPEDVVVGKVQKDAIFDDAAIDAALARLDKLAGLAGVKKAIHNFVQSARYLHSIGEPYVGKGLLSWRFIGKSGTGKSTVAEIMACILKGMRLIANSHITEVKGERIFNASDSDCDAVLKEAVKKSCNGLIFIDIDDPKFIDTRSAYGRSIEQIRLKVKELTVEVGGECALILAELEAPNSNVAEQLSESGIHEFDHTLIFKDFSAEELYEILCHCLGKFGISFTPAAEKHMREYLRSMNASAPTNARTMKLMSRTIQQQVILRESGLSKRPAEHKVQLSDIETFKWNGKMGRIGF